jgi:FKBP-type peptidyl-prolyl cis-trans isomerase
MKLTLFTLLVLSTICFVSCRKNGNNIDLKQYDQQQIQNYIAVNGITGMQRDLTNGDTTGIYYKIINPGDPTKPVDYPDSISYVYSAVTFDGKFASTDTVLNHYEGLLGHVVPNGLMLSMRNLLKYKGAKMRVLIPSHLAYGEKGVHTGSNTVVNNNINGNQCLDFTINLISDQAAYDALVLKNYIAANNLTGFTLLTTGPAKGMYYKIKTAGTGASINDNSNITCNFTLQLMNNTVDTTYVKSVTANFNDPLTLAVGPRVGFEMVKAGSDLELLMPSRLAYGVVGAPSANVPIPVNACLRYEFFNITVTNY